MIEANRHVAAMAPYALADLSVAAGKRPISLAQNESPLAPSPLAIAAGQQALASSYLYPDPDWTELRAAIAEVHGVDPTGILCGAGSMELIACLARGYAGPGHRALSSQYGYAFFRSAALAVDAGFDQAAEEDLTLSVNNLLAAARDETRIVFIANPGNPTGTRIPRDELVRLRNGLAEDILLVIDEAYGEFADTLGEATFDLVARGNTVVLRTLSKAYGLAGLRVGWGLFPPAVAVELRKLLNPNNISGASEAAAAAALRDQAYMRESRAETIRRRDSFAEELRALGLKVPPSCTNFVLVGFADTESAVSADRALRAEGILMRGMAGYGLAHCLRATIGSELDMQSALETLARWHHKEDLQ